MTLEELKNYCLSKKAAKINFPFDETTMTFIVGEKIFGLIDISSKDLRINLKCNPQLALLLREDFEGIIPGYHMNKTHWNTIYLNKDVPDVKIKELIDHSYALVFAKLTKKIRENINLKFSD
ncbi:MAG: MmcQ/YjbR family DNA-binding protein [Fusobacteriaceae bacterium]|nr:MmcQ/YjbR family DNA-binding protein [Fusobacteriaceae bacterium]MBP6466415.1 MmcQ/YjbR family DNA-binding protein [Fusobacteriaceae bacterium]MBU9919143.1 MmcQ/YjbR family DNA-binding protein [Fusobacteriaceae bacterium]